MGHCAPQCRRRCGKMPNVQAVTFPKAALHFSISLRVPTDTRTCWARTGQTRPAKVFSAARARTIMPPGQTSTMNLPVWEGTKENLCLDEFAGQSFDYVVTACDNARDNCPVLPSSAKRIHWSFEDPAAVEGTAEVRLAVPPHSRSDSRARQQVLCRTRLKTPGTRRSSRAIEYPRQHRRETAAIRSPTLNARNPGQRRTPWWMAAKPGPAGEARLPKRLYKRSLSCNR
jgi:hypothetical protein